MISVYREEDRLRVPPQAFHRNLRKCYIEPRAGRIKAVNDPAEIEQALDDLEFLMEVLDPELQDPAYQLAEQLRAKFESSQG